jgi:hypothetical protein
MKTMNNVTTGGNSTKLSLHKLVDDVIKVSSPDPAHCKSHIANNVPSNFYVNTNEDIVTTVIRGLLHAVITNAADGDIHISAKELFSNTIKVSVKDNNSYNTYAIACSLQNMVPLAEQIGGYLNIMNQKQKITTVEFSFPDVNEDDQSESDN